MQCHLSPIINLIASTTHYHSLSHTFFLGVEATIRFWFIRGCTTTKFVS